MELKKIKLRVAVRKKSYEPKKIVPTRVLETKRPIAMRHNKINIKHTLIEY